jgi:hypothetical protein
MTAGILQLELYGAQDIYLTGNPQITFFKSVYKRYTNFSIESIQHNFNKVPTFGDKVTVKIPKNGDMLYNMEIQVTIPEVSVSGSEQYRWLNWLGHILIEYVTINIGPSEIDRQYGAWMHIWNELTRTSGHQSGYANLVGNVPKLVQSSSGAVPSVVLYIPLQFWFCKNPGLALPLVALQHHDVNITVKFNDKANCYWQSSSGRTPGDFSSAYLFVDYIHLGAKERRKFAQTNLEYLIEQVQVKRNHNIPQNTTSDNIKLSNFNHPVKELVWVVQKDNIISASDMTNYGGQQWFNFTDAIDKTYFSGTPQDPLGGGIGTAAFNVGNFHNSLPMTGFANSNGTVSAGVSSNVGVNIGALTFNDLFGDPDSFTPSNARGWTADIDVFDSGENCISTAKIQLNGQDRTQLREGRYFNLLQPLKHHTNTPATGINMYSFSLKPEEHQPSGTCNFTELDSATLVLNLTTNSTSDSTAKAHIYATNYNILKITNGMAGLAYAI